MKNQKSKFKVGDLVEADVELSYIDPLTVLRRYLPPGTLAIVAGFEETPYKRMSWGSYIKVSIPGHGKYWMLERNFYKAKTNENQKT